MADKEYAEDGRAIIPLSPSSPVDPRAQLPEEQRQTRTRLLGNGTVLTEYVEPPLTDPPTADQFRPLTDDEDEIYEAHIAEVIAEYDAEQREETRRLFGPWERNNLRQMMAAERTAKQAA